MVKEEGVICDIFSPPPPQLEQRDKVKGTEWARGSDGAVCKTASPPAHNGVFSLEFGLGRKGVHCRAGVCTSAQPLRASPARPEPC